jgi:hypothetical protein
MNRENEAPITEQKDERPDWERPRLFPLDLADAENGDGGNHLDGQSSS